jgi:hypothetical protein
MKGITKYTVYTALYLLCIDGAYTYAVMQILIWINSNIASNNALISSAIILVVFFIIARLYIQYYNTMILPKPIPDFGASIMFWYVVLINNPSMVTHSVGYVSLIDTFDTVGTYSLLRIDQFDIVPKLIYHASFFLPGLMWFLLTYIKARILAHNKTE